MDIFMMVAVVTVAWAVVEIFRQKYKNTEKADDTRVEQLEATVNKLKERIEVLESLVTDQSYQVKREIERL
ncbi:hypothetical protein [Aliidiomarina sanyensis]|uniref:Phage shock protein B n=1 Tax=Aliidiomarina sanyensis TaxID=1249555 RepID=A0A432WRP2_9GAMM|nr:hypothetical protein [Aliidiomarina sanyensis]RUO36431.1 hypothetical protein CWE11_01025 [Aliidiomarina sanyensis]